MAGVTAADTIGPDPSPTRAAPGSDFPQAASRQQSSPDVTTPVDARMSYGIPAGEILLFNALLNGFDRLVLGERYESSPSSIRRNLRSNWRADDDTFLVNQLGHPYQGSMFHGFARSAGLGYWTSVGYTLGGSTVWEIAGEVRPPSLNDQITTTLGGSFFGEILFRMSQLVLQEADMPRFWREAAAAVISPPTGFNRLAFGDRFQHVFAAHEPVYFGHLALGARTATRSEAGRSGKKFQHNEAVAEFSLDYGLPGKPGYTYERPFDYFSVNATVSSANAFDTLTTRGLLIGTDYAIGQHYRGLWGLYGSFDYLEPQTFRVSSTALSLGTTAQWWIAPAVALQGSALAGAGYAAVGTVNGATDNDNDFGLVPQALVALRLIFGNRAAVDTTVREYFVSRIGDAYRSERDTILRADAAFTLRVHRQHALSLRYLLSRRSTGTEAAGDTNQSNASVGLYYVYLGNAGFGAVDWRDSAH